MFWRGSVRAPGREPGFHDPLFFGTLRRGPGGDFADHFRDGCCFPDEREPGLSVNGFCMPPLFRHHILWDAEAVFWGG